MAKNDKLGQEHAFLGNRLKDLRIQANLTLNELGQKSGLSKSYLSKIENNKTSPSIPTLWKLANSLGIGLGDFFQTVEQPNQNSPVILRAQERKVVARGISTFGYTYEALAHPIEGSRIQPFTVHFSKQHKSTSTLVHPGYEFNYLLEGSIEFFYGDQSYVMHQGDSWYYDSSIPHRGTVKESNEATVLSILIVDDTD